ncbi:uncharacterized protein C9orf40 homolog [Pelodytes ibericus]
MAKRKIEQHLVTLHPPCKKAACELPPSHSPPQCLAPKRKRKLDHDSSTVPEVTQSSPCRRVIPEDNTTSRKKTKLAETQPSKAPYKCEVDEDFREFNSYEFWKAPLPEVDFSEIEFESCDDNKTKATLVSSTGTTDDMDS